jgi:hypothetical protein
MDTTNRRLTEDDLLQAMEDALRQAEETGDGALTAAEMKDALGVSIKRVYNAMDALGKLIECIHVRRMNRANRITVIPAYRLKQTGGSQHEGHYQQPGPSGHE